MVEVSGEHKLHAGQRGQGDNSHFSHFWIYFQKIQNKENKFMYTNTSKIEYVLYKICTAVRRVKTIWSVCLWWCSGGLTAEPGESRGKRWEALHQANMRKNNNKQTNKQAPNIFQQIVGSLDLLISNRKLKKKTKNRFLIYLNHPGLNTGTTVSIQYNI